MDPNATYLRDVTYREVRAALAAINQNLRGQKLDPKITLRLSNNRMELEKCNEKFETAVEELEDTRLKRDDEGNPITEKREVQGPGSPVQEVKVYDDREAFLEEVNELLDEPVSGGLRMENIPYDAFGPIDEQTLSALRNLFLDFGEDDEEDAPEEDAPDEE